MKYYFEKRNKFTCPNCGKSFRTTFWKWLSCPHLFDIWRYIKCPGCGKRSWMKRVKNTGEYFVVPLYMRLRDEDWVKCEDCVYSDDCVGKEYNDGGCYHGEEIAE